MPKTPATRRGGGRAGRKHVAEDIGLGPPTSPATLRREATQGDEGEGDATAAARQC